MVAFVASAALLVRRTVRLRVDGASMEPTLAAGDHVIALRLRRPRAGDIVAVRDPRLPTRTMVKRVRSVSAGDVFVVGDDPGHSTDSRHFGAVPRELVRGVVILSYRPGGAVRWIVLPSTRPGKPEGQQR